MSDAIEIKTESTTDNMASPPLENDEHFEESINNPTSSTQEQQTPQLQATEVTSTGTVTSIPTMNRLNQKLKHSLDLHQYTLKHPLISKYLTDNIDCFENPNQNKCSTNTEGELVRRGFTGPEDIASQKGIFGWSTIDGINLPYLFRFNVKYVAVRMVEMSLLSRYPPEIPSTAKDQPPIISYYVTDNEVQLLNEINISHCSYEFGYIPYDLKDLLVKLTDVERFYTMVKVHYSKSETEIESPDLVHIENLRLARAKQTIVPYIVRNGEKLVALNSLKKDLFLTGDKKFDEFTLSSWEIKHLNSCYELMGIPCELDPLSKVVMLNELQLHCDVADLGIVTIGKLNDIQGMSTENKSESIKSSEHSNIVLQNAVAPRSTNCHRSPSPTLKSYNKNNSDQPKALSPQRLPPPLIAMPTSHVQKAPPIQPSPSLTPSMDSLLVISHVESLANSPNTNLERLSENQRDKNSDTAPLNLSFSKETLQKMQVNCSNTLPFPPTNHNLERSREYTEFSNTSQFSSQNYNQERPQEHMESIFSNNSSFSQVNNSRERLQKQTDSKISPFHPTNFNQEALPKYTESNSLPFHNQEISREHTESKASLFSPTNHQERSQVQIDSNILNSVQFSSINHNPSNNYTMREVKTQDNSHCQMNRPLEVLAVLDKPTESDQTNSEYCSICENHWQMTNSASQRQNLRKDEDVPVISNIFSLHLEKELPFFPSDPTNNNPVYSYKTNMLVNHIDHPSTIQNDPIQIHIKDYTSNNQNSHMPLTNQNNKILLPNGESEVRLIYDRQHSIRNEEFDSHEYQEIIKHSFLQEQLAASQNHEKVSKMDGFRNLQLSLQDIPVDEINAVAERALWEDHYSDKDEEMLNRFKLLSKFGSKTDSREDNNQQTTGKITNSPIGAQRGSINFKIQLTLIADQLLPTVNLDQYKLNTPNRAVLLSFVLCTFFPRENFKSLAFVLENILNVNLLHICSGQVLAYKRFFSRLWAKHSWSLTMIRVDDLIRYLPQLRFVFHNNSINGKHKTSDDFSKMDNLNPIENKRSRSQ